MSAEERQEELQDGPPSEPSTSQPAPEKKKPKTFRRIDLPSPEQMMQEDFMNNCATRTVVSGVMGMGLGVCFGIFFGTMDSAVRTGSRAAHCAQRHRLSLYDLGVRAQGMGAGSMAPPDPAAPKQTTGQVFRQMLTTTRQRSWCAHACSRSAVRQPALTGRSPTQVVRQGLWRRGRPVCRV